MILPEVKRETRRLTTSCMRLVTGLGLLPFRFSLRTGSLREERLGRMMGVISVLSIMMLVHLGEMGLRLLALAAVTLSSVLHLWCYQLTVGHP